MRFLKYLENKYILASVRGPFLGLSEEFELYDTNILCHPDIKPGITILFLSEVDLNVHFTYIYFNVF